MSVTITKEDIEEILAEHEAGRVKWTGDPNWGVDGKR